MKLTRDESIAVRECLLRTALACGAEAKKQEDTGYADGGKQFMQTQQLLLQALAKIEIEHELQNEPLRTSN